MNARTVTTLLAGIFLMTVLQLLVALMSVWAAVACWVLLVPLTLAVYHFFDVEIANKWVEIGTPALASVMGVTIAYFAAGPDAELWLAPPAAAAVAGLVVLFRNTRSRRCGLCNCRLGRAVAFNCPRCGLLVCEQNCWSFEHCRCRLCDQNRVPIFTPDGRWWDKQFGPRSSYGRCQLCLTAGDATDLRVCGKCGRPQCRECWDFSNGQCSRCQWTVADLPEALREYVIPSARAERSGRG
jgi:hypothetical protein